MDLRTRTRLTTFCVLLATVATLGGNGLTPVAMGQPPKPPSGPPNKAPDPPALPDPPKIPDAPLPPFTLDRATFATGGTELSKPGNRCPGHYGHFKLEGTNIALAASIEMQGAGIDWNRELPSTGCMGPNCLMLRIIATTATATGVRSVRPKAVDGRSHVATFNVVPTQAPACQVRGAPPTGRTDRHVAPPAQPAPVHRLATSQRKMCGTAQPMDYSPRTPEAMVLRTEQVLDLEVTFDASQTCYCANAKSHCDLPNAGHNWRLKNSAGDVTVIPWQVGRYQTPQAVPAGTWRIELTDVLSPPGTYGVTYTP